MHVIQRFHIKPQSGVAFVVATGNVIRVISPEKEQVADLIAFSHSHPREWLSSGRTIDYAGSIFVSKKARSIQTGAT